MTDTPDDEKTGKLTADIVHLVPVVGDSDAGKQHQAMAAATERHALPAARSARILMARARTLVANGVDLRNPEALADMINDQVMDAVNAATVPDCGCEGSQGPAAVSLIAQLVRIYAEDTRHAR